MGSKCSDCGIESKYQEIYDFHHLDPNHKDFMIGKCDKSFSKIVEELEKCVMLCANCHRIRHTQNQRDLVAAQTDRGQ